MNAVNPQAQIAIETVGLDELRALQLERLRWSLVHAYNNVPFYRQSFDRHGIHPDDLNSLEALASFPFSAKENLRDNYPFGMFAVPREQVVRVHASSGTTGKPTVVAEPDSPTAALYLQMADNIAAAVAHKGNDAVRHFPEIKISDD